MFIRFYILYILYNIGPQSAVDREFIYIASSSRSLSRPKRSQRRPKRSPRPPERLPRHPQDTPKASQISQELPRAPQSPNWSKWPSQTRCFTMSDLNFWTTLRYFCFKNVLTMAFWALRKNKNSKRLSLFDIGPSQTMCFTMSGLNFWTTLRDFFLQIVLTMVFWALRTHTFFVTVKILVASGRRDGTFLLNPNESCGILFWTKRLSANPTTHARIKDWR